MANNIFEKYGIKEVADVTFYDTETNKPVLFLDTLKVSTIEQTAEQTSARGGKGNPELIVWDYGKEITLNLEDALFSPQSMNLMLGGMEGKKLKNDLINGNNLNDITRMTKFEAADIGASETRTEYFARKHISVEADTTETKAAVKWYNPSNMERITDADDLFENVLKVYKYAYCEKTYTSDGTNGTGKAAGKVTGKKIEISAANFPGTYRIVGETFARSQNTGKDEYFQFEIPKAKMSAENTITLEAEGDPSVFNMTMKVLRPEAGPMITLKQYDLEDVYNVTFDVTTHASDLTVTTAPADQIIVSGEKATQPTTVTASDSEKTVVWKKGDVTWNFNTEVTEDMTLVATAETPSQG